MNRFCSSCLHHSSRIASKGYFILELYFSFLCGTWASQGVLLSLVVKAFSSCGAILQLDVLSSCSCQYGVGTRRTCLTRKGHADSVNLCSVLQSGYQLYHLVLYYLEYRPKTFWLFYWIISWSQLLFLWLIWLIRILKFLFVGIHSRRLCRLHWR